MERNYTENGPRKNTRNQELDKMIIDLVVSSLNPFFNSNDQYVRPATILQIIRSLVCTSPNNFEFRDYVLSSGLFILFFFRRNTKDFFMFLFCSKNYNFLP